MLGSIWRYAHFLLAAISSLFLLLASITGCILSVEPVAKSLLPYKTVDLNTVQLSETVAVLKENYDEVFELQITSEDFVQVSVFTKGGSSETIYINPKTGDKLGDVQKQSTFFSFVTNLHRSLFLKAVGRFFLGVVSLLLCFIAVTGIFLLAHHQGGFKKWFSKVKEKDFVQRYHIVLGRWLLLPILTLAVTGVYLSAEKFSLLPKRNITHTTLTSNHNDFTTTKSPIKFFEHITLNEVRELTFPFSDAPEDYFELALYDREFRIHQFSSEILSEATYPFVKLASLWSLQWHTGQGSVLWSLILFVASVSLLFFMYSGFAMSLRRKRKSKKNHSKWTKDEAEFIVLTGSETGNTQLFAKAFCTALENTGKRVYCNTLNSYTEYANASHLIVFTSTYGDGDAPSNARKFEAMFHKVQSKNTIHFTVVGFGSLSYTHYCHFAIKVDGLLESRSNFQQLLPIAKINNQSQAAFAEWIKDWNVHSGLPLKVTMPGMQKNKTVLKDFKVIDRKALNVDNTTLIRFRPLKKTKFQSGDLLNIIPPEGSTIRQYSIAKIGDDILLSVKWHPKGLCSNYLCTIQPNTIISASIEKNPGFHFPKKATTVCMIANGTGIAPYLGMFSENQKANVELIWGARTKASFDYYQTYIENALSRNQLRGYELALSQVEEKKYVQDIVLNKKQEIAQILREGGVLMLCGSVAMQNDVLKVLEEITKTQLQQSLYHFQNRGQLLMDCY